MNDKWRDGDKKKKGERREAWGGEEVGGQRGGGERREPRKGRKRRGRQAGRSAG